MGNIDRLASFRSLAGKILTGSLGQLVFAIQLENIERENFDSCRLLAKCQIRQYFRHQNFVLYGMSEFCST